MMGNMLWRMGNITPLPLWMADNSNCLPLN